MTDYKIVRTEIAGVFCGKIEKRLSETSIVLNDARRIWYWSGAASLSQLAMEGVKCPEECKFPISVTRVELTGVCEILDMTYEAKKSIDSVKIWSA